MVTQRLPPDTAPELIVGRASNINTSRSWYAPAALGQGFIALPFGEEEREALASLSGGLPEDVEEYVLAHFSIELILKCAILGIQVVDQYVPTAALNVYAGYQSSVVWSKHGHQIRSLDGYEHDRADWPLNAALRELGAKVGSHIDECDALGLYDVWTRSYWKPKWLSI